jgi:hypothetical protein
MCVCVDIEYFGQLCVSYFKVYMCVCMCVCVRLILTNDLC